MAVTDVVRPTSVRKAGAGTSVPSGTLAAVTSDNSDATYIDLNLADTGNNWNLRVGSHTPSAGYQRHQIRGRIRIRTNAGTANEDIDLGRGTEDYIQYGTVAVTSAVTELVTNWFQDTAYGLATAGALADLNIGGGWMADAAGGANELRTAECYVDIDCRLSPQFSPEVQDSAGADQSGGTVTDTNQPTVFLGAVNYDGLPALNWAVAVRSGSAAGPDVFVSSGSGIPPTSVDVSFGLDNGNYAAVITVSSTIRGADPYASEEVILFAIDNVVPAPSPPLVTVEPWAGGYLVQWEDPGGQEWDDGYVVAEVWRDDCTGSQRIATVPNGLNGSYLDLAIPQLDPQPVNGEDGCAEESQGCDITYRIRYWGYVSTFVELPEFIPEELILGWPSTVGSIPSGWTRVTALDGYYPRGSNGTGAPSITGGSPSHMHTTSGHVHWIATHDHGAGGSTGTSNASTTSARFNGASQPQADQPHSHSIPASTGDAGGRNSGSADPDASFANNDPLHRTVIWIKSGGAQAAYPVGILGWATESVSGWVTDTDSSGRYLKGAATAANGGVNGGANTHIHSIASHSHDGFSHDHGISGTGLSNPSSSQEAGTGSSTPRWLPRHTHPLNVFAGDTGDTNSVSGGSTDSDTLEPVNRRLRVLRNTDGGAQTRIIGLYTGAVADLDPLLTLCDGSNGTPDMRGWFCRDAGTASINSIGGINTHTHSTPNHNHDIGNHSHTIDVGQSNNTSYEAPSSGDLGSSPTTTHDHSGGSTDNASPDVSAATSGTTSIGNHIPQYKEVHFIRLDGTIGAGPLPVPELKTSEFSSTTVPAFTYADGLDRLASMTAKSAVVTDRSSQFPRLVTDSIPLDGGKHTVSNTFAGEDLSLTIGVQGKPAIDELEALLASDRLYWSPVGGEPGWFAPGSWTVAAPAPEVKVVQITMVRQTWPETPEPTEYL